MLGEGRTVNRRSRSVTSKHGRRPESGAALVEFAVLAPLLALLLLGIIEFGYLFAQYNEVRHAAREGARYAAVSNPDRTGGGVDANDVIDAVCSALNLPGGASFALLVTAEAPDGTVLTGTNVGAGNSGRLTITATIPSLSGAPLISDFLPTDLTNTAVFRIEQPTAWAAPINQSPVTCP